MQNLLHIILYVKRKILKDFHICISLPLRYLFRWRYNAKRSRNLNFSIIALLSSLFMKGACFTLTVLEFKGACFSNVLYNTFVNLL